jgi:2-polyprenyl-6-methoxyphenol hydroxylase-like FAD-dependent oxidoreductase
MTKIAVIGAGQAGLLLGIGLVDRGHRVTLVSDRTPEQVLASAIPAGSMVFHDGLEIERELGVALWNEAATIDAVRIEIVAPDGSLGLFIEERLDYPALCVDQRLKIVRWMEVFRQRGGQLVVKPATVSDLETYARDNDLVVVAAGKGELTGLFARDDARSPFRAPARHASMVVVDGLPPWENFKTSGTKFRILPGIGEVFSAPIYMNGNKQSTFIGIEAIPGSPMDRVVRGMTAAAQLAASKELIREFIPWDYSAIRDAEPGHERDYLCGALVPIVRRPVATLPSGAVVMGLADTVNLMDPIAAQGANNAAKVARMVRNRITEHGERPFDAAWMESVFDQAWDYMRYGNLLCQRLLLPPAPHALEIFGAASQNRIVANRLVNGFNHPPSLFPWFADPDEAHKFMAAALSASG